MADADHIGGLQLPPLTYRAIAHQPRQEMLELSGYESLRPICSLLTPASAATIYISHIVGSCLFHLWVMSDF